MFRCVVLAAMVVGCGSSHHGLPDGPLANHDDAPAQSADAPTLHDDAAIDGSAAIDGAAIDGATADAAMVDAVAISADAAVTPDAAVMPDATTTTGVITGGPCLSGAAGATAYRIRWADSGGTAYPVYEVDGLPDHSRDMAGAYGYEIGFTASFVDMFLGEGGVQLDDSDFIDLEISTAGVSQISLATLSIYGRSYSVDTDGSFNWQTFDGTGATPDDFVSNVAPYSWWSADMTTEIMPGDSGVLIRVKAGPGSDALVVNRIELCLSAT